MQECLSSAVQMKLVKMIAWIKEVYNFYLAFSLMTQIPE